MPAAPNPPPLDLALRLASHGWHVFPLAPRTRRPLANCPACRETRGRPAHSIENCPCLPAGRWCHGVRAATVDPERLTAWWCQHSDAVPGAAAGPSGLVLVDIDTHGAALPDDLATGLLPGIDLAAEPIAADRWRDPARFRDGRDALALLAEVRGETHPWPAGPTWRPVGVDTPSGGRHLWYQAPADDLRQSLAQHGHGLAWRVDIKAGWSYGVAPGATAANGHYRITAGDITSPGRTPGWFGREVVRVAGPRPVVPAAFSQPARRVDGVGPARYVRSVVDSGAEALRSLDDGRQTELSRLAYQVGGLLAWSGLTETDVEADLIDAGCRSGLTYTRAARTVRRALANGTTRPYAPASTRTA